MTIFDAGAYQAWIAAFDNYDQAQRRYDAAAALGSSSLIEYLRAQRDTAAGEYDMAIRTLKQT